MNDMIRLFPNDISDETAAVIGNMLAELVETWQWRYFNQIHRFGEANTPESIDDDFFGHKPSAKH